MGRLLEMFYTLTMTLAASLLLNPAQWLLVKLGRLPPTVARQRRGEPPPLPAPAGPRWLLHGASAGELAASAPLLTALAARRPDLEIVISASNAAGLATARRLQQDHPMVRGVTCLPWDRHRILVAWLRRLRVRQVLVLETELWPGLYRACDTLGIPLRLLNARLYPTELTRYRWIVPLMRRTLARVAWLGARDGADATRLRRLGACPARLAVVGELRFDLPMAPDPGGHLPGGRWILAASTHAPEERWLLAAFAALAPGRSDLRLVLAPRRVARSASIAHAARRRGLRVACWSTLPARADWQVLILDRLGVLPGLYGQAAVVFIGGSFGRQGGHSPVEAALHGRAMVTGPAVAHVAAMVATLRAVDGICQIAAANALAGTLAALLDDPAAARRLGDNARRWALGERGAAGRYANALLPTAPSGTGMGGRGAPG